MATTWKRSKQWELFELIKDEVAATGRMPSTRFIAAAMDYPSTGNVKQALEALALSGRLVRRTEAMRGGRRFRVTYDLAPARGGRSLDTVAHRGAL